MWKYVFYNIWAKIVDLEGYLIGRGGPFMRVGLCIMEVWLTLRVCGVSSSLFVPMGDRLLSP